MRLEGNVGLALNIIVGGSFYSIIFLETPVPNRYVIVENWKFYKIFFIAFIYITRDVFLMSLLFIYQISRQYMFDHRITYLLHLRNIRVPFVQKHNIIQAIMLMK